jgi:chorismate mutase
MDKIIKSRETIDFIDNNILVLLKERFEIVKKIKEIKIKNKIEILDKEREKNIYDNIYNNFNEYYIYFKPIFEIILKESKIYQSNRITITDL